MAFLILPIVSLVLYIIGFYSSSLVVYMAAVGLALAIFSYYRCRQAPAKNLYLNIGKYLSLAMIVMGAVYLVVILLSQFVLGPVLSSII